MKITQVRILPVTLPLRAPIPTTRGPITQRQVLLVWAREAGGAIGMGEAAPLPEFRGETYATAARVLSGLARRGDFEECENTLEGIARWREQAGLSVSECPVSCFAVESALLAVSAQLVACPLLELMADDKPDWVYVNTLLTGATVSELLTETARAEAAGYGTVKIKGGVRPWHEDAELIRILFRAYPHLKIRIDPNGSWSADETAHFWAETRTFSLEYIEDPVPAAELPALLAHADAEGIRLALDETAPEDFNIANWPEALREAVRVRIVKPPLWGSYMRIAEAYRAGLPMIFTSFFDSSIGLVHSLACATVFGADDLAHGLDTARLLSEDTLRTRVLADTGRLHFRDIRLIPKQLRADLAQPFEA